MSIESIFVILFVLTKTIDLDTFCLLVLIASIELLVACLNGVNQHNQCDKNTKLVSSLSEQGAFVSLMASCKIHLSWSLNYNRELTKVLRQQYFRPSYTIVHNKASSYSECL